MATTSTAFNVNERIHHHMYGHGTVRMVDESHTIIDFDENGRRKFVTSIVRLERSEVAAPERMRSKPRKKAKAAK